MIRYPYPTKPFRLIKVIDFDIVQKESDAEIHIRFEINHSWENSHTLQKWLYREGFDRFIRCVFLDVLHEFEVYVIKKLDLIQKEQSLKTEQQFFNNIQFIFHQYTVSTVDLKLSLISNDISIKELQQIIFSSEIEVIDNHHPNPELSLKLKWKEEGNIFDKQSPSFTSYYDLWDISDPIFLSVELNKFKSTFAKTKEGATFVRPPQKFPSNVENDDVLPWDIVQTSTEKQPTVELTGQWWHFLHRS